MDIFEMQQKQRELENQVTKALRKFEVETNLSIDSINLDKRLRVGKRHPEIVAVEIQVRL